MRAYIDVLKKALLLKATDLAPFLPTALGSGAHSGSSSSSITTPTPHNVLKISPHLTPAQLAAALLQASGAEVHAALQDEMKRNVESLREASDALHRAREDKAAALESLRVKHEEEKLRMNTTAQQRLEATQRAAEEHANELKKLMESITANSKVLIAKAEAGEAAALAKVQQLQVEKDTLLDHAKEGKIKEELWAAKEAQLRATMTQAEAHHASETSKLKQDLVERDHIAEVERAQWRERERQWETTVAEANRRIEALKEHIGRQDEKMTELEQVEKVLTAHDKDIRKLYEVQATELTGAKARVGMLESAVRRLLQGKKTMLVRLDALMSANGLLVREVKRLSALNAEQRSMLHTLMSAYQSPDTESADDLDVDEQFQTGGQKATRRGRGRLDSSTGTSSDEEHKAMKKSYRSRLGVSERELANLRTTLERMMVGMDQETKRTVAEYERIGDELAKGLQLKEGKEKGREIDNQQGEEEEGVDQALFAITGPEEGLEKEIASLKEAFHCLTKDRAHPSSGGSSSSVGSSGHCLGSSDEGDDTSLTSAPIDSIMLTELHALREQSSKMLSRIHELESTAETLRLQVQQRSAELKRERTVSDGLRGQLQKALNQASVSERKSDELSNDVDDLSEAFEQYKAESDEELRKVKESLMRCDNDRLRLKSEVERLLSELSVAEAAVTAGKAAMKQSIEAQKRDLQDRESEIDVLQSQLREGTKREVEMRRHIVALEAKIEALTSCGGSNYEKKGTAGMVRVHHVRERPSEVDVDVNVGYTDARGHKSDGEDHTQRSQSTTPSRSRGGDYRATGAAAATSSTGGDGVMAKPYPAMSTNMTSNNTGPKYDITGSLYISPRKPKTRASTSPSSSSSSELTSTTHGGSSVAPRRHRQLFGESTRAPSSSLSSSSSTPSSTSSEPAPLAAKLKRIQDTFARLKAAR